jgi:phosphocarrier protein HPr
MIVKKMIIRNKMGLHARPAALFVETASRYRADVWLSKDGVQVNGKSIMGILMLAAEYGNEIELKVEGRDEQEALEELTELLEGKFNED